ncbi:MAG TPA: hypothetical protein VG826_18755 [Pirellulales bacterium]|nr:hypothetical protein [Pirellulales bacterium]
MPRFFPLLTILGLLASAAGCRREDEIRQYTVPKQSRVDRLGGNGTETAGPQRMLAAVVLQPSQGWFFKLMGAEEAVNARADEFETFLKSVHFQDGAPQWSLPKGWREEAGNEFRYATLKIEGTPLEVSVSTLPRGEADETEYVLNNVNRWRGQLGLNAIRPDELQRETKQVELEGSTATYVDLVGEAKSDSMSPPFASGLARDASGLTYEVPQGWREEPPSGIRKASFRIAEGETTADVSIIDLEASVAELLPNVNRWREQIKLGPTTQREIDKQVQSIAVGDREGQYLEMLGDDKATLVAILKAAGRAWFIKLTGDKSLVEGQRDHFKSFVHSLSIGEAAGAADGN